MADLKTVDAPARDTAADLLVVGVTKGNQLTADAAEVNAALDGQLAAHLARTTSADGKKSFDGSVGQTTVLPSFGRLRADAVMAVGLGEAHEVEAEAVRRAAGAAARAGGGYRKVALRVAGSVQGGGRAAAEGFLLGLYVFDRYLSDKPKRSEEVGVAGASIADLRLAQIYTDATAWARDLVNEPPSSRGPSVVAELASERASAAGLQVEVFDEDGMAGLGMNGILTVGKGSDAPPRFVVVTYAPEEGTGSLGLIGKGITFDSGGLSIKTSEGMETMKMDCSGAAAVLAAVTSLPALAPRTRVTAAVALAENMSGGRAVKPGDVIRHYGGHTSEVLNTDAEGRLVLADVLAWMSEREPDAMVDVATLTGAMAVALGPKVAGVIGNDDALCHELLQASARTGEPLWHMPLVGDYRSMIASEVADVKNISGTRYGGAIVAALFLKDFVGETPWAHLDIAGPAWVDKPEHYLSPGASGYGTRLLLDWIISRAG
ncbi:MAG TPA: leucyl aminopeptidase [Actinomycetota bacterium]|nr:leucyl aminopeptidase [Actinomycetota bacterium]